jgi:hypothetical protein
MNWTGPKQGKLRKVLLSIYPSLFKLRLFIKDNFECNLTDIGGTSPEEWAEELITKAASEGWIDELYEQFCLINKDDSRIHELLKELDDTFRLVTLLPSANIIGESDSTSTVSEDDKTAHLVISLFKTGTSKEEKFIVYAKFCYTKNSPQALGIDNGNIIKKDEVSKYLEERINDAKTELKKLCNETHFNLVIGFFLPTDLLSYPLHQWYGQENKYLKLYPIVMGCSDRFISEIVSHSSFDLRNRLKKGWSRFQSIIPDEKRLNISELKWLKSDDADMESLADFTGFCCSGNWLQPGKQYLEKWQELIDSGIPLALWRCNTHLARENLTVFEHLIAHNRFDFLMRIPNIRERQQKMKEDYVGVFYEDLDYLPDIPKQLNYPGT